MLTPAWVDDPGEVTPAWMTAVLRRSGFQTTVSGLHFEAIGTGQIGRSFRFHLDQQGDAPGTVVVKLAGGAPSSRSMIKHGYEKEVGFYRTFADSVEIRTPRCWYHAISEDLITFTLVLEDLDPAVPGVQAKGCTVEQAVDAVRNLAGLHAPTWNDSALLADVAWLTPHDEEGSRFLGELLVTSTETFVDRYKSRLSPDDQETLRQAAARMGRWSTLAPRPFSLIHGDYRLDNLLFPDGPGVVAVDWQTLTIGPPTRDLAYFIGTSVLTEDRRAHERRLVKEYHAALVVLGVTDFGADACFEGYRLGMLHGPMITVLGCLYASTEASEASDGMFLAMAARSCAALRDLGSFELVDQGGRP